MRLEGDDRTDACPLRDHRLASLNHPNIAQIYGIETLDAVNALVIELVEGPTLEDRIAEGSIPADEALSIAGQIADALEAAHEQGIVHRDLKPANIKLRDDGTVKVLDFGIAKANESRATSDPMAQALTSPAQTQAGIVLGTAAYMSPEQARGRAVDQRTDIWAFGCILYEMLTGQPTFAGEDRTSTLARVLEREINTDSLPTSLAPSVERTVALCLEKDPRRRVADIRDVKLALAGTFETASRAAVGETASQRRSPWLLASAASVVTAIVVAGAGYLATSGVEQAPRLDRPRWPLEVFPIAERPDEIRQITGPYQLLALSPDASRLALPDGVGFINLKWLDRFDTAPVLIDTNGARLTSTCFNPEGDSIAFGAWTDFELFSDASSIQKASVVGGSPSQVVPLDFIPRGGCYWGEDGFIYFAGWRDSDVLDTGAIFRARDGAALEPDLLIDGLVEPRVAQLVPGGGQLLFTAREIGEDRDDTSADEAAVFVLELDGSGNYERLLERAGSARYLATGPTKGLRDSLGHLLYLREGRLWAAPVDLRARLMGDSFVVEERIWGNFTGIISPLALTQEGALAYYTGSWTDDTRPQATAIISETLTVRDASGTELDSITIGTSLRGFGIWMSPTGSLAAGLFDDGRGPDADSNLHLLGTDPLRLGSELTLHGEAGPFVWSPDENWVIYQKALLPDGAAAASQIFVVGTDGRRREHTFVAAGNESIQLQSFFEYEDRTVLFGVGNGQIHTLTLPSPFDPEALDGEEYAWEPWPLNYENIGTVQISPNGEQLAFVDGNGSPGPGAPRRRQAYVTTYPEPGRVEPVPMATDVFLLFWNVDDANELYLIIDSRADGPAVQAVSIDSTSGISISNPVEVFRPTDRLMGFGFTDEGLFFLKCRRPLRIRETRSPTSRPQFGSFRILSNGLKSRRGRKLGRAIDSAECEQVPRPRRAPCGYRAALTAANLL